MRAVSLDGKTVCVGDNDHTNALELIQYFYPSHRIIQEEDIFPQGKGHIFVEDYSPAVASSLRGNVNRRVICAVKTGGFDIDFTDRLVVLEFVYAKWGMEAGYLFAEDDIENIRSMELLDFYNFIKPRWVSKDMCLCDETAAVVNIHAIIGRGFNEILRFSDRITDDNAPILEMGFIQFIETARLKTFNKSKAYLRHNELYRKFNVNFDNDYIAPVLARYRAMANNRRFKLIWLLSQFSFKGAEGMT